MDSGVVNKSPNGAWLNKRDHKLDLGVQTRLPIGAGYTEVIKRSRVYIIGHQIGLRVQNTSIIGAACTK